MTNRANRRRNKARARRRDDARLPGLLERARVHVRDLGRRGSVYDFVREVETEDARRALGAAIVAIVNEELLTPLTTGAPRRREFGRPLSALDATWSGDSGHDESPRS